MFVVSRGLTDLFLWSQWVWWVPAVWFVALGWGVLGLSVLVGWLGKKRGRSGRRRFLLWGVVVGCVGMSLNLVFGVWRVQNVIGGYGIHWSSVYENGRVRVLHWNLAAGEIDVERTVEWIGESNVDVVLIANARFDGQRRGLVEGLEWVFGDEGSVRRLSRGVVASRFEIVRSSVVYVSASGGEKTGEKADKEAMRSTGDFGWVVMLSFDRGEGVVGDERLFDVWFVDFPSEPRVHRVESMGGVVAMLRERAEGLNPALIVGDFNVVRGSGSLGLFDVFEDGGGFVDAFEERGAGSGSWRSTGLGGLKGWVAGRSSWHIDLSLVGNRWEATGYELLMPDGGVWGGGGGVSHRAQVVDIFPVK